MTYRYSLRDTGISSHSLGTCEICKQWCDSVWTQVEERKYNQSPTGLTYQEGWTVKGCHHLFGHKECLESKQKNQSSTETTTGEIMKTFADFKRRLQPLQPVRIHNFGTGKTRDTVVTSVKTKSFAVLSITGQDAWTDFYKASDWLITENSATLRNGDQPMLSLTFLE